MARSHAHFLVPLMTMMNNLCIYDKCLFSNLFVLVKLMSAGIFVSAVSCLGFFDEYSYFKIKEELLSSDIPIGGIIMMCFAENEEIYLLMYVFVIFMNYF